MSQNQYSEVSQAINAIITKQYSTSFSVAIRLLDKSIRTDIYNIYGYVRVADELVDTLRPKDSLRMLKDFNIETTQAIKVGVSLNPVIHAFAQTVIKYQIDYSLIQAFINSMTMDISKKSYNKKQYKDYIYGSAEVVGLMCLMVFLGGNKTKYKKLTLGAKALGSAFQKVNFLRDLNIDNQELGRIYFPNIDIENFQSDQKKQIEQEILADFKIAQSTIYQLPYSSRYGVLLAYWYYRLLLRKIQKTSAQVLKEKRVRVSDITKLLLYIVVFGEKLLHI